MYVHFKHLSIVAASLLIIGCGGGTTPESNQGNDQGNDQGSNSETTTQKKVTITEETQQESLGKSKKIHATVNLGNTPKTLYVLLSNTDTTNSASAQISSDAKVVPTSENKRLLSTSSVADQPKILHAPAYIQEFNSNVKALLQKSSNIEYQAKKINTVKQEKDIVGSSTASFCTDINKDTGDCVSQTNATARKVVSDVTTSFGSKTLNIWVSDDSFDSGSGCSKAKCVTQEMVDELADNFLKDGLDNDIYDWVTNIYDEEWGSDAADKYSNVIGANDEITILLTDIGNDNSPSGGTIGYFWSKDNFNSLSISGSNERIMFYADSVMFANEEDEGFWQKEMYSTLAHEFQHMIHFYQKAILLEAMDDTWINEMISETTEDLVATKIQHTGPRGVTYTDGSAGERGNTKGRYPEFNSEGITRSLTQWDGDTASYSKVSSFGTFLTRNYGGAKVLHDIVHNNKEHEDAIMEAVHKYAGAEDKTFEDLLSEWGVAVMLSDKVNPEDLPTYNTGDFTENTYNQSTYKLGSINFYNYDPVPTFNTTTSGNVPSQGNYYYKVGENLTGTVQIDLSLNGKTEATLIAK